ncbi:tetracycline resistance MFS efflux pump [Mucilaginibacter myungsuensis]|uniref:MFS transporter n=2 Tax=Mucilaginibacter myungsuensis TaxID=649104 RepID=A0A929PZD9_9SPHI|nr:MFS transporter [Mucilaginibacter myungsuensis]
MKADKNLWILVLICVINSLGFGIIMPLLYSYGKKFGVNEQTIGLLTAAFSIAQFFATPVMGAMSDKFGRKPLLVFSLIGTLISFLMFAWAGSIFVLFAARILDGLTGGNVSVAQAMVSDTSTSKDRAKKFGILSSAFGAGFVLGPAAGGLLSELGEQVPFFFAAGISLIGTLCTIFFLKETHPPDKRGEKKTKYKFTFMSLISTLKRNVIGTTIFIGFLLAMAQFTMITGFQTFSVDVLELNNIQIGLFFAAFGVCGILAQLAVPLITKLIPSKSLILLISTALCCGSMVLSGFTSVFLMFAACMCVYSLFNGLRNPMLNAIIADHNDAARQGEVMGVNQSYASIGQTLGPITASAVIAISIHSPFFLSGVYIFIALLLSFRLLAKAKKDK